MKPSAPYQLAIVLPMYKPKQDWQVNLKNNIHEVQEALSTVSIQFIVVNDGFETRQLLQEFDLLEAVCPDLKFISYAANAGKGFALRTGVTAANADYTIVTDLDFPYQMANLAEMYQQLQVGYDIVAGKRSQEYYREVPLKRKVISKACIWANSFLLNLPDCDTQSGLKGFNSKGKKVFLATTINRFLIDTEFLLMASRKHLSIKKIIIELRPAVQFSSMGLMILLAETKNFFLILKRVKLQGKDYTLQTDEQPQNIPDFRFRGV